MTDAGVNEGNRRKEQTVLIAIAANVALIGLRFTLAFISGSLALRANAWHSLADVVVLGVVYLGLVLMAQCHEKWRGVIVRVENVVAIIVALFIFTMGLELFREAISGDGADLEYVTWAALGAFFGVCITYFMGRYLLYVGERTQSPSLIAAGYHARMDMFCSGAVLVGLVGSIFGMSGLDKVAATIVVVFIFLAAGEILLTNLRALRSPEGALPEHAHGPGIGRSGRFIAAGVILLCALGYFASGLYSVPTDAAAVVRRFGRVTGDVVGSGLHYRWPFPFEQVDIVRVSNMREIDTEQELLLSGDENLVEVKVAVHFRVDDPVRFLLGAADPGQLVLNAAQASVRSVIGRGAIDDLLTSGRDRLRRETRDALQTELDRSRVGVEVIDVLILHIAPPEAVKPAFQDVASAREDRATYINEAWSFRNDLIPRARGEAAETVLSADAYKTEKVNNAVGEGKRFLRKAKEYSRARGVTRTRLYLEAMEKILPGVRKVLIGAGVETEGTDLWFLGPGAKAPFMER